MTGTTSEPIYRPRTTSTGGWAVDVSSGSTLAPDNGTPSIPSRYVTITGNVLVDCPYGICALPGTEQAIITGNICYPNTLPPAIFVSGGATVVGYTDEYHPGTNVVSA